MGAGAVLMQWGLAGFWVAAAVHPSVAGGDGLGARALALGFAAIFYALGRWGRGRVRRAPRLRASVTITPDQLVLRHDWMLKSPVTIPRETVAEIVGGDRRVPRRDPRSGARLPLLDPQPREPNLALLFVHPVDFPARRSIEVPDRPIRRPGNGESGVLIRVEDPEAARAVLTPTKPVLPDPRYTSGLSV
jgi:hypothetical protein